MSNINYTITSGVPDFLVTLIGPTTNMQNIHTTITSGSFSGFASEPLTLTITDSLGCTESSTLNVCENCYPGYSSISNGNCLKIDSYTAPSDGTTYEIEKKATTSAYGYYGPLVFDQGYTSNGVGTYERFGAGETYWTNNGAGNGPMNRESVWSLYPEQTHSNQDISFTYCFNVAATKTYYVGFACDNYGYIKLNGVEILRQVIGNTTTPNTLAYMLKNEDIQTSFLTRLTFQYWYIYPVVIDSGKVILEVGGHNVDSLAAIGVVIYDNTILDLKNATDDSDLNILFHSSARDGDNLDYSYDPVNGFNGYFCGDDYGLNSCGEIVTCDRRMEIPCDSTPTFYLVSLVYKAADPNDLCAINGTLVTTIYSSTVSDTLRENIRYYNVDGTAFDGTGFYFSNPECVNCEYGTIGVDGVYNMTTNCTTTTTTTIPVYVARYDNSKPIVIDSDGNIIREPVSGGYTPMSTNRKNANYDSTNKVLMYSVGSSTVVVRDVTTTLVDGKTFSTGLSSNGYIQISDNGVWFVASTNTSEAKYKVAVSYDDMYNMDGNMTSSTITGYVNDVTRASNGNFYYVTNNQIVLVPALGSTSVILHSANSTKNFITGAGVTNPKLLTYNTLNSGSKANYSNYSSWSYWSVNTSDSQIITYVKTYNRYSFIVSNLGDLYVVNHDDIVFGSSAGISITPPNFKVYSIDIDSSGNLHICGRNLALPRYEIRTNVPYNILYVNYENNWTLHSHYPTIINQIWVY